MNKLKDICKELKINYFDNQDELNQWLADVSHTEQVVVLDEGRANDKKL